MKAKSTEIVNYTNLTDQEVQFYKNNGYLLLPNFINKDHVEKLAEECLEAIEAEGINREKLNKATDVADKLRNTNIYFENSGLDELINGKRTLHIASQLIGGKAHRYFPFVVIKAGGGGGDFDFHQDNNYTQHEPAEGSLNIWVALVDMTPENGCLQIVPESQKRGVLEWEKVEGDNIHKKIKGEIGNALPVRMRAGDAIAFSRLLVHGSGKNETPKPRIAYALQYHREDIKYLDKETQNWKPLIELSKNRFHPQKK